MTYDPNQSGNNPYGSGENPGYGQDPNAQGFGQNYGQNYGQGYGENAGQGFGHGGQQGQPNYGYGAQGQQFGQGYGDAGFGAPGYQQAAYGAPGIPATGAYAGPGSSEVGVANGLDVGTVLSRAWSGFASNVAGWIVFGIAYVVAMFVAFIPFMMSFLPAIEDASNNPNGELTTLSAGSMFGGIALSTVLAVVLMGTLSNMGILAALRSASGERLSVGDFFKLRNFGQFILVVIVWAVIFCVLQFLPLIGPIISLVLMYFFYFAVYAAVDGHSFAKSFSISKDIAIRNAGLCILSAIVFMLISFVGGLVLIGSIITYPLTLIGAAVIYLATTRGYAQQTIAQPSYPQNF
ncbi:EI24 domain-containing protein [Dietzia sp.]|uniref:EI24 domain-containing protein n=1 Tax=Dietzia sp. TaxID=1871616 RepID=UPI002FDA73D9